MTRSFNATLPRSRSVAGLVLLVSTALAGCTLIPDYQRPALPVASTYPSGPAYGSDSTKPAVTTQAADRIGWKDFFRDPRLRALISLGLANNRDLRVAALNIAQAQAEFGVQQANLFPTINATGSDLVEGLPATPTTQLSTGSASGGSRSSIAPAGSTGVYRYYTANLGFTSYELDVFGRLRSLSAQALETYFADEATARSVELTLVSEIATAYLTQAADQALLDLSQETLASQRKSYDLTKATVDQGTGTALSLRQIETSVLTAQANVVQYTRQVAQDENALVLLLGQPLPKDLPPGLALDAQGLLADIPAGLPADLLAQRPDIAAAEHTLLAANANIGAVRAAFFPSITLTATDGIASPQLSKFFGAGATTYTIAPQINIPLFSFGKTESNLAVAKAERDSEIAQYEKTVQTAFRETADALAARGTYGQQVTAEQNLVNAAAASYELSELRFKNGVDNYLSTLDSQRTLYQAQQTLINVKAARLTNLVTLYKVLGGGFTSQQASNP